MIRPRRTKRRSEVRRGSSTERRLEDLVAAFNDYPPGARQTLMLEWPDLFFATSRLVRYHEVVTGR